MPTNLAKSSGLRMAVLFEGGLAVLAVVLAWLFRVPIREMLPATWDDASVVVVRGLAATLPLVVAFWWLVRSRWSAAQRLRRQAEQLIDELFRGATLADLALVSVLAGVGEELLFRGVLQTLLAGWTNELAGLVVAGLIFGLLHALSLLYFVLATLVGFYFGWLLMHYGDLTAPIIAHAFYDVFALAYLRRKGNS